MEFILKSTTPHTKQSLVKLLTELGVNTRANFRKTTGLPDSTWESHFGNWKSFVRAANLEDTVYTNRYKSAIAKQEQSSEKLRGIQAQKESWGDIYTKESPRTL